MVSRKRFGGESSRSSPELYTLYQVPILDQALLDFEERWINLESQHPLASEAVLAGGSGAAAYLAVLSVRKSLFSSPAVIFGMELTSALAASGRTTGMLEGVPLRRVAHPGVADWLCSNRHGWCRGGRGLSHGLIMAKVASTPSLLHGSNLNSF